LENLRVFIDDQEWAKECILTSDGVEDELLSDSDKELYVSSDEASELDNTSNTAL